MHIEYGVNPDTKYIIGNPTRFLLFLLFLISKEKVVDTEDKFMVLLKIG
jgi:hypothetical protein